MPSSCSITPTTVLAAALLGVALASAGAMPAAGQAEPRLPDKYQFMVGRDVPQASGYLESLKDVTVAPDGTVYLLDGGTSGREAARRVLRLAHTGRLMGAWGGVGSPTALTVTPDGVVHVADEESRRMLRFTPWGTFIDAWPLEDGSGTSPCRSTETVAALAAGQDGQIYIAAGNHIQVRDAAGHCVAAWQTSDAPRDIAVDDDGRVYAALYHHSKVEVFDASGTLALAFGRSGTGPGEFGTCDYWEGPYKAGKRPCGPIGLALAPDGTLLAADYGNGRILRFSRDGNHIASWSTGRQRNGSCGPEYLAVGANGTVYVTSYSSRGSSRMQVDAYTADGTRLGMRDTGAPPSRALRSPRSVAVGPSGDVYVADTENHRIQHLDADGQFLGAWGALGWGAADMSAPQGVAVAPDGTVVVADTGNRRLQRFDAVGTLIDIVSPVVEGRPLFAAPCGVAVAGNGDIYVADPGADRVVWLGADGRLKGEIDARAGPGSAMLLSPAAVAVDEGGSVWVADTGNDRIVHISPSGAVTGTWGTPGAAVGQFDNPTGIEVTRDGAVIVVDEGNRRLQRFSPDGGYPDDVEVIGAAGCGRGQFCGSPADVAIAGDGTIIVAGAWRNHLTRFGADGVPLPSWGYGSPGDARLDTPAAVAASSDGTVYIADSGNRRIQRVSARGELLESFGEPGCGAGQLTAISSVAVAENGDLYVAQPDTHRVARYGADGALLRSWDPPDPSHTLFHDIRAVDEAPSGDVYVADFQRVTRFDSEGRLLNTIVPPDAFGDTPQLSPYDMVVAEDGTVFTIGVTPPWVRQFSPSGVLLSAWASSDDPSMWCAQPGLVAPAPDGSTYSYTEDMHIQHCDRDGKRIGEWGGQGSDPGRFEFILAMAVAPSGEVFVLDSWQDRVQVFTPTGELLRYWATPAHVFDFDLAPDGSLLLLAAYDNVSGRVYRTDEDGVLLGEWEVDDVRNYYDHIAATSDGWMLAYGNSVLIYSGEGELRHSWRSTLVGPEVFEMPLGVATALGADRRQILYVSDSGNGRIQAYDADGRHLATLGREGRAPGEFMRPAGLALDRAGALLVADSGNHRIQQLTPSGEVLGVWGSKGNAPGELSNPMGVALTDDDIVLVADTGNRRVQAFTLDGLFVGAWDGSGDVGGRFTAPTAIAVAADGNVWVADGEAQVLVFGAAAPRFWHARMYRDQSLLDGPVHTTTADQLNFDWGLGAPGVGLPADGFSVRVERPAGSLPGGHAAELTVYGGVTLSVGRADPPIIAKGSPAIRRDALDLDEARALVRLDYADFGGRAALRLALGHQSNMWFPIALKR